MLLRLNRIKFPPPAPNFQQRSTPRVCRRIPPALPAGPRVDAKMAPTPRPAGAKMAPTPRPARTNRHLPCTVLVLLLALCRGEVVDELLKAAVKQCLVQDRTGACACDGTSCSDDPRFGGPIAGWDTSEVTSMASLFLPLPGTTREFNADVSRWDTSRVTNVAAMFADLITFNQDLASWDTAKVEIAYGVFQQAAAFRGDISAWDTSNMLTMAQLFRSSAFDGNISGWDVSRVTSLKETFRDSPFDADVSRWDTSSVTVMLAAFRETGFNQDISTWDTASVADMSNMCVRRRRLAFPLPLPRTQVRLSPSIQRGARGVGHFECCGDNRDVRWPDSTLLAQHVQFRTAGSTKPRISTRPFRGGTRQR